MLLVTVDVDDDGLDGQEAIVSGNPKLDDGLVTLTERGTSLYVDTCDREVDEERRMFLSADSQRATTNEGDAERTGRLGRLDSHYVDWNGKS